MIALSPDSGPSQVRLRKPLEGDVAARMAAGFSAEILRMYGHVSDTLPEASRARAEGWVHSLAEHPCAWVIEADGRPVGEARLDAIDTADHWARLAIGLLHERDLGRGIGRCAVRLVLHHAFDVLALHRVDLRVLSYNLRAIRCYQSCGFIHEGTERESAMVAGIWHDDWIMAILDQEYRSWLLKGPAKG